MSRFAMVAAIFMLCCPGAFSQHGGGGGGSSGGSFGGGSSNSSSGGGSSSSGGGSHGGYSGGSSSSGGGSGGSHGSGGNGSSGSGHTSGGSHGYSASPTHVAGGSGSSTGAFVSRSVADIRSGGVHVVEIQAVTEGNVRVVLDRQSTRQVEQMVKARNSEREIQDFIRERAHANLNPFAPKTEIREHRSFLGLLRHPFRKAEATDLRHRICLSGPCVVCPVGNHRIGGGCGGASDISQTRQVCSPFSNGNCSSPGFPDDCNALRQALQQQAQRLQDAESAQQSACARGASQGCSDSASAAQNERDRYRATQDQYRMCRQRASTSPFGGRAPGASSPVLR